MTSPELPETVALVLNFRDHRRTARCIDSLFADGIRSVCVVDNSEDAGVSCRELAKLVHGWSSAGLEVDVTRPGPNLGFSAGVNHGLARIRRRHGAACVLLLNNDATVRPGAHAALRAAVAARPSVAAGCMVARDGATTVAAYYHRLLGLLTRRPLPGAYRYLSACCMMIHPELARGDMFDEDFFFYGEDIELGWRLSAGGIEQIAVPQAVVDHEGSATSRNGSLFYEYHMARAHLLLPRKLAGPGIGRSAMYLARSITLPLRGLARAARFRSTTPWRGLLLACSDVAAGRTRSLTPAAGP